MGKNKDEMPNPMNVTNRDVLQRLNFLYQASVFLNGLAPHPDYDDSSPPNDKVTDTEVERPNGSRRRRRRRVVSFRELSRSYVDTMKTVGQKTNVRVDPSVKRRICKRCSAPLVPGISATVRVKESSSHGHLISYECHGCKTERRIPAPPILHADLPTSEDTSGGQPAEAATSSAPSTIADNRPQKRKKRGPQPRMPPHFARDIGHVVFCGNERLDTARRVS